MKIAYLYSNLDKKVYIEQSKQQSWFQLEEVVLSLTLLYGHNFKKRFSDADWGWVWHLIQVDYQTCYNLKILKWVNEEKPCIRVKHKRTQ